MKFFLASQGSDPATIQNLDTYINGFEKKHIAYIPTAGNAEGWQSWQQGHTWQFLQHSLAEVTTLILEEMDSSSVRQTLEAADVIWVAGGMVGYLLYWMRRREMDAYIKDLPNNLVYVGSSAGSMIVGQSIEAASWFPGDPERGVEIFPALQLVDFDIFPHYEESQLSYIQDHYMGKKLYLLKDNEAIIFENGVTHFLGEPREFVSKIKKD